MFLLLLLLHSPPPPQKKKEKKTGKIAGFFFSFTLRAEVSLSVYYEVIREACLSHSWFVHVPWETSAANRFSRKQTNYVTDKPNERLRNR